MNFDFKNQKPSQNSEINIDIITSPKNNAHSDRQILNADQPIKEEKINQITGIFQQLFGKRDNLAEKTNLDQIDDLYFKKQQKKQEQENPIIYKINNKKESFFRLFLGLLQLTCILLDFKMHTVLNALQVKKIAESNNQANLDIQVYVLWVYTMMTLLASHLTWYRLPLKRKYFLPDRKRVQMQQKQKNKKFNFLELFTGKKTSSKNNKSAQQSIIPEETKCQKFSVFLSSLNGYLFAFFSMIGLPPIYYYFYSFFTNRGDQDIDQFLYSQTGSRKVWAHLQSVMSTFLSCHYIFTNRDNGYIGLRTCKINIQ
ncbi:hypothetical protein PPERSA_08277 [Pseudocohnilembus persalinus]|uniref:Transmembrane protein n=1 Tax=Pseudocohnilembus persalinus TaxID=266149 RepID=A0A0V0Q793_PSEPJ|nr:hypothetical protein PPERSA_08277 [Pseudocohnilembus persalinus]|eukprot:KRW98114.1 hypothetical protein PPERSA_08277 [Pseudocohnilembus persalinus]